MVYSKCFSRSKVKKNAKQKYRAHRKYLIIFIALKSLKNEEQNGFMKLTDSELVTNKMIGSMANIPQRIILSFLDSKYKGEKMYFQTCKIILL